MRGQPIAVRRSGPHEHRRNRSSACCESYEILLLSVSFRRISIFIPPVFQVSSWLTFLSQTPVCMVQLLLEVFKYFSRSAAVMFDAAKIQYLLVWFFLVGNTWFASYNFQDILRNVSFVAQAIRHCVQIPNYLLISLPLTARPPRGPGKLSASVIDGTFLL
jgi:hypothetical protein